MDPTPLTSTRPHSHLADGHKRLMSTCLALRNIIRLMERGDSADDAVSHPNVNAAEPVSFQEINTFMKEMISIFKSRYQSIDPATNKGLRMYQDPTTIRDSQDS
jgi:hypothetical protein